MQQKLPRRLGLTLLTLYGLGNILGAGIYVLVGKVTEASGGAAPVAFMLAAIIAGLTAFSYMELSSRFPFSAGASMYVNEGFGIPRLSRIVGLLMVTSGIVSAATLAHGFAGYARDFLPWDKLQLVILVMVILGAIAAWGIKQTAQLASVFTVIELCGLAAIIWLGRHALSNTANIEQHTFTLGTMGVAGVVGGAFLAFYAYIGFEDMVNVAEEAKRAQRNMPLAILISLIASTVLYMLVVLVAARTVPAHELARSGAPLSLVFSSLTNVSPLVISGIGLASTLNGILVNMIMGSRLLYGMSSRGWLPPFLSRINGRTKTPVIATAIVVVLMIISGLALPLVSLAKVTSFLVLTILVLVNLALIFVKIKRPVAKDIFRVPLAVPVLAALSSLALVVHQAWDALA